MATQCEGTALRQEMREREGKGRREEERREVRLLVSHLSGVARGEGLSSAPLPILRVAISAAASTSATTLRSAAGGRESCGRVWYDSSDGL